MATTNHIVYIPPFSLSLSRTHPRTHTHIHIHAHALSLTHTHQEANTLIATGNMDAGMAKIKYIVHIPPLPHTHIHTHIHAHTFTHTHTLSLTHTHTPGGKHIDSNRQHGRRHGKDERGHGA